MGITPVAAVVGVVAAAAVVGILVRVRRLEPATPPVVPAAIGLAAVLVVAVAMSLVVGADDALRRDEAIFVVTNVEVANGNLPYVAAFDPTGPVGPWYGGLGVAVGRALDVDPVTAARLAYLPIALLGVAAAFMAARVAGVGTAAAAVGATALAVLPSFAREALSGPRPKAIVLLLVVLLVVALARERFLVAGVVVGVSVLVWQATVVLALVPVVHALWRRPPSSPVRAAGLFVAGGLAVAAPVGIVFAAAGHLPALVEGLVTWNLQWGTARLPASPIEAVANPLRDVWGGHMATWSLVAAGALALARHGGPRETGGSNPAAGRAREHALVALALLGVWTLIDYQGVVDLLPFWGLVAVGVALVAEEVLSRSVGLGIALVVVVLVAGLVDVVRVDDDGLAAQRAEVAALVGDGCRVVSYGQPELLALTGQSNPRPEFAFRAGAGGPRPDDPAAYVSALVEERPQVVGGWTHPDGGELGAAAASLLPAAGYEPVDSTRFEAWRLRTGAC